MRTRRVGATAVALIGLCTGVATATATTLELGIKAYTDGRDHLVIKGGSLQWHHLDFAAVGRHEGHNEATMISTWLDGVPQMSDVAWVPAWLAPPPDEIRFEAWSSIYSGAWPVVPSSELTVTVIPDSVRWDAHLVQAPTRANSYQTVVEFNDNPPGGPAWYHVKVRFDYRTIPEPGMGLAGLIACLGFVAIPGVRACCRRT